ncbi:hypothetical protein EC2845650_1401 [Escherichia coli 2845650]|nr:hypothetical protein EC2845650_1401 [Escherichia coli 2845650]ESA64444.1 hypothetical protein HMPREF1589_04466 [Escherichia coli 113290]EZK23936.1 hypothetical protein AB26_1363 [Escherichia coli 2-011-08_S1_C2]
MADIKITGICSLMMLQKWKVKKAWRGEKIHLPQYWIFKQV